MHHFPDLKHTSHATQHWLEICSLLAPQFYKYIDKMGGGESEQNYDCNKRPRRQLQGGEAKYI